MKPWSHLLLHHLRTCPACVRAKALRTPSNCPRRQELVKETLKERHG